MPDPGTGDWRVVAQAQGSCITRQQLLAGGATSAWVSRAVSAGALLPLARGVYRLGEAADLSWTAVWAALLAGGPRAFAFRRTAAAIWGLSDCGGGGASPESTLVEIGVARNRHLRVSPSLHRVRYLVAGDITRREGLRITTPLRTLTDLATLRDPALLERCVESALRLRLVADSELRRVEWVLARAGGPTWRTVVDRRPVGAPATESDAETAFVQLCRRFGLPEPTRQLEVVLGRRHRLDFAWIDERVAVEVDGRAVHGPDMLGADLRRQNRIVLAGWLILRFTYEDLVRFPADTAQQVGRALALGGTWAGGAD
jgi:very-short-patch-repair endonuclease